MRKTNIVLLVLLEIVDFYYFLFIFFPNISLFTQFNFLDSTILSLMGAISPRVLSLVLWFTILKLLIIDKVEDFSNYRIIIYSTLFLLFYTIYSVWGIFSSTSAPLILLLINPVFSLLSITKIYISSYFLLKKTL